MTNKPICETLTDIQVGDLMRGMGMTYRVLEVYPGGFFRGECVGINGEPPGIKLIHENASLREYTRVTPIINNQNN